MTDDDTTQQKTRPGPPGAESRLIAGRYVITGELGRGGMGVVWRAQDRVIGREVAIKEVRLGEIAEDVGAFQERVLREVRTGGRLNDSAVVTVYDVVHEGDSIFIVMELVQAPTLAELVDHHGPLPPHQVAAIGLQVLSALRAAHDMGIVHRDVKPANIMVAPNGRVKLADFGIAKAIDDTQLTVSGAIVGSPAFIAPERVEGREATPASDVWSLGVTLYVAVEGVTPFTRPSTAAVLHAILHEVPVLNRAQGPLASAIMGMLVRSPQARIHPAQAEALLQQAGNVAVPAPTSPYPGVAAPTMQAGRFPTRSTGIRRWMVITAAVLAVVLLVSGVFLGLWLSSPGDPAMAPTLFYGPDAIKFDGSSTSASNSCYNGQLVNGHTIDSNSEVSCSQPHDLEQIGDYDILGSSSSNATPARYPDSAQLRTYAQDRCGLTFHSNAIKDADRPNLVYHALVPTSQAWNTPTKSSSSDPIRTAYCLVSRRDNGQLDHSVQVEIK